MELLDGMPLAARRAPESVTRELVKQVCAWDAMVSSRKVNNNAQYFLIIM